ncbi:MAG: Carbohydrate esterase 2 N-terminal [Gammaproteobacteria bacterium]|nr:Carbohydrate esterase 2 N-terminal [Gammaproteobacteria bacterium]
MLLPGYATAQHTGIKLLGRWLPPESAPTSTYAGSTVILSFRHSSRITADFKVSNSKGSQDLFLAVTVDGGKPTRLALARGFHAGVVLASGLSAGAHLVAVRKEGEPYFGALQFTNPKLDVAGRWQPITDDKPIIEVIGDSGATGICALGPDSPEDAVSIRNSAWASQALSWVGLLDAGLAAVGHPVDMVDLAMSGSTARSEAASYDFTAPGYSDEHFGDYSQPGRRHAAVVFMWGGANDHHGGGDVASESPVAYANLSRFQKGIYDQLTKVFARNPDAKVVLLGYIDSTIPDWRPAYDEVLGLLAASERGRISFLRVHDPKGQSDACEIDPKGHPNLSMHASWAAQILEWMLSRDVLRELGLPDREQWDDE